MGIFHSRLKSHPTNKVFEKDLKQIEDILNSILSKDNQAFTNSKYNLLNNEVCDKYTMVIESRLSKYLKIHLKDLASNIYFVPKENEDLHLSNGSNVTKKDLCNIITSHYTRTLKILSTIREIYDLENGGDYSLAGILFRNLDSVEGMYEVSYCGLNQESLNQHEGDKSKVNFNKLKGLKRFVNEILTDEESRTFLAHLRQLFDNFNKSKIAEAICKDTIVSLDTYKHIYEDMDINIDCRVHTPKSYKVNPKKGMKGGNMSMMNNQSTTITKVVIGSPSQPIVMIKKASRHIDTPMDPVIFNNKKAKDKDLFFYVSKDKPILSYDLCYDKHKMMMPTDKKIKALFNKFKNDYVNNLQNLITVINKLVYFCKKSKTYKLNHLSHDQLSAVEIETKKVIIVFFIQSIVNYYKIFNYIKRSKHLSR